MRSELLQRVKAPFIELLTTLKWYRCTPAFRKADQRLKRAYGLFGAYHLARSKKWKQLGSIEKNLPPFGHTPLKTLEEIAKLANVSKGMHVFELGCGTGRSSLWLSMCLGCKVTGVDHFEPFIEKAQKACRQGLTDQSTIENSIKFICSDLLDVDYSLAQCIYFYSTGFDEAYIKKLSCALNSAPKGCRLITISFPLKECDKETPFYVKKRKKVIFPWGEAFAFLQIKGD